LVSGFLRCQLLLQVGPFAQNELQGVAGEDLILLREELSVAIQQGGEDDPALLRELSPVGDLEDVIDASRAFAAADYSSLRIDSVGSFSVSNEASSVSRFSRIARSMMDVLLRRS
jgi:hypothetical protein